SSSDPKCFCGFLRSQHNSQTGSLAPDTWKSETHTRSIPTNAYGDLEFIGYGENEKKYIRVDVNQPMEDMLELLMKVWGLEKPNLLISVTGGAKNFKMKQKLKEVFRRGLLKVARSTGAWIVTGGTNTGVMKHIGEAVRDYGLATTQPIIAIGIATWGVIQNKEELINNEGLGKWPATYRIDKREKRGESFLDPNHTHFILADNGTQHQFGVEITMRACIENAIANMKTDTGTDAVTIPVVLLVLEGGPGTLETAHQAIANNTPVVIVEGSGRAADILAYAYLNSQGEEVEVFDQKGQKKKVVQTIFEPSVEATIKEMIEANFTKKNSTTQCEMVKECLKDRDLVTVFNLKEMSEGGGSRTSTDVDKAVLKALLKANKDQIFDQLKLALAWNRIDIAKSEIFTDDRVVVPAQLCEIMQSAVLLNRVDFVELFLDNGVSIKDFLTKKRLLYLYNNIPKNCHLCHLLKKMKLKTGNKGKYATLFDVGLLIKELIGDFYQCHYFLDKNFHDMDVELLLDGVSAKSAQVPGLKKGILGFATGTLDTNDLETNSDCPVPTKSISDFDNPYQELFLWAILMNRLQLAKVMWKQGKDAMVAALVANAMLSSMAEKTDDTELAKKYVDNAEIFSDLAISVLNECYEIDEIKTQNLLVREIEHWGRVTCVLIAVESDNRHFIAQTACQQLLNNVWMGNLSLDNHTWQLILCICMPPLMFPLVKYKAVEENSAGKEKAKFEAEKQYSGQKPHAMLVHQKSQKNLHDKSAAVDIYEDTSHNVPRIPFWRKIYYFYKAPVIIFAHNVISYVIFLALYSYMLLVEFSSSVSPVEIVLIIWVFSIFAEEIRQVVTSSSKTVKARLHSYITNTWNVVDMLTIIMFLTGIVLRFLPFDDTLEAARLILGLNLVVFFMRILHIFSVHKELGPKLVMIGKMLMDLMYFIIILLVFVISYAIAAHAVLYPNSTFNFDLIVQVCRRGYWNLYGELFLDELELEEPNCSFDPALYSNGTFQRCPTTIGRYAVPIMMAIYVLFSNILLLNLLIAMFSYTFQLIQRNTDIHWFFQRYSLILEYMTRPFLVPPFLILSHIAELLQWLFSKCSCCKCCPAPSNTTLVKRFSPDKARELVQWENVIADSFLHRQEQNEKQDVQYRVIQVQDRIENLLSRLDELQEAQSYPTAPGAATQTAVVPASPAVYPVVKVPPQIEKRLAAVEEQMNSTNVALNWIVEALKEQGLGSKTRAPALVDRQAEEKKKEELKRAQDREMRTTMVSKRMDIHYKSRIIHYPGSQVQRFPVPDDKVYWDIPYPEYSPTTYEAPEVKALPPWADTLDLINMPVARRLNKINFNAFDAVSKCSRTSYLGPYKVEQGLPLNPKGRTGMVGRGLLGRYGPNHSGDPVVTRWKRDDKGQRMRQDGKYMLEFVAIQRKDNNLWSLPGGMCEPGQKVYECLKAEFTEEALGSLINDEKKKDEINKKLHIIFENGKEIYKGYADDPRNTDNAWIETLVYNYHDEEGSVLSKFVLRAGETVEAASWLPVSGSRTLHGAHSYYLKLAAERLDAFF
ncbi:hypothetical protein FSP39_003210, partial [Pinctada imbricata]